ncbi:MAG: hypothetical protein AAGU74_06440 [Bacillota bacterium]
MNKRKALLLGYILLGTLCLAGCLDLGDTVTNPANTSVPPSLEETLVSDTTRLSQSEDSHQRVRAWVEDGNACLALDGIFWREYLGVEIAQDIYQVNGLDGACAGIYVDTLGWRIAPMVLFLMEDGTVEYLDVENALLQGAEPAGTFTSMGTLSGLSGIVDFIPGYSGDAETYDGVYAADNKTVFAIDRSGQKFDVFLAYTAKDRVDE